MSVIDTSTPLGQRLRERLDTEGVIWLTVVNSNGKPFPTPVWFLPLDEDHLAIYSQQDRLKVKAIANNPQVSLNFNSDQTGGDIGVIHGTAEIAQDIPPLTSLRGYVEKYAEGIKYLNSTPEQLAAEYPVTIRVRIDKVHGW